MKELTGSKHSNFERVRKMKKVQLSQGEIIEKVRSLINSKKFMKAWDLAQTDDLARLYFLDHRPIPKSRKSREDARKISGEIQCAYFQDLPNGHFGKNSRVSHWEVKLKYKKRKMNTRFFTGSGISYPTISMVVESLFSDYVDEQESFEFWCYNSGFDPDSRSHLRIFQECQKQSRKLEKFLSSDFQKFQDAYFENEDWENFCLEEE